MPQQFTSQNVSEHMRRGSSQTMHPEMTTQSLPTGPGRGNFTPGRGRGSYTGGYQSSVGYSPNNFRPNQGGRNMQTGYQGQGRHQLPYQGSPSLGSRTPVMHNATPGTPQMPHMNMMPGMQNQPAGYPMGPYQVNTPFPPFLDPARGKPTRGRGRGPRGGRGRAQSSRGGLEVGVLPRGGPVSNHYMASAPEFLSPHFRLPDLSPESGNFEHFLTMQKQQGYGVPTAADPSIQYMYNTNYFQQPQMQGQYYQNAPPQSPRPPFQQTGYATHMQPTFSNQGQGAPSMSRQSSQMSATTTDRPSSSVGQTPHTPGMSAPTAGARTPSISASKSDFTLPTKKSAAIQIKNSAGEVVTFGKGSSSSAATPAISTPVIPTPPSRTGSAADHTRSDSNAKTDDEKKKAMQEAVAKKVAEEQARIKQAKDAADQKAQMDKEAAELAEREAAKAKEEAEALEREAKEAEAAEAAKAAAAAAAAAEAEAEAEKAAVEKAAAEKAASEAQAAEAAKPADNDEPDYDAIEAELAALEAEEARREEEYQKKKAATREAQRKKEEEEAAAYEANMKEMERKAEEEELEREKKAKDGVTDDEVAKRMFAALKTGGEAATPTSTADDSPAQTPAESGAVTPVSDTSMPPPKGTGKRSKVADLTLDIKKTVEPPEPSATLKSLTKARRLEDPTKVDYPAGIVSPNPALNQNAPADRKFKYDKDFLLQFQSVFKEKPSLDWDAKIREALGDGDANSARPGTARTPSGMGGRSASTRTSTSGAFTPMGNFGGRPSLPPGTTSEQRFAASTAALRGGPMSNPFAFGRPGNMGPPMGRTPSNNPLGGIPGSPRVGGSSRGGSRAESKRGKHNTKAHAEENKSMPLTAGMQITALETSSTGWKPRSIGQQASAGPVPGADHLEPDVVQRKVKAALNKMTPEKFDKIADQILDIAAQSKNETDGRTLRQVIQLTFEKATDEAHWAPMYAMFCRKMLQSMSPEIKDENIKDKNGDVVTGGNLFRKYLLNRCQEEFERGWKVNLPGRKEGETEETALLSEEYYVAAAAKRRGLGLVRFIGELFKLGMLTERIMHECVKKLVDYEGTPDESEVESLTNLLRTIGKQLDSPESRAQGRMDVYFERINQTINIPDLPSRLRFMLMDVVDLRRRGWASAAADKGPKTIAEIHEEAERAAQKAEMQRLATQTGGNRGGGRMPMGRGDARSFSGYGQAPPPDNSNRVGADDLRRLGGRVSRNASSTAGPSLGPPSMLAGRTNSGRRGLGPGGLLSRGDDSAASSRTGTPPATKDKDKKDESSTNAFR